MSTTILGPDGKARCRWCGAAPEFLHYHDTQWGFPISDDRKLFEKLCLESFQSGLIWRTILAKRENFRAAFHNFEFNRVAVSQNTMLNAFSRTKASSATAARLRRSLITPAGPRISLNGKAHWRLSSGAMNQTLNNFAHRKVRQPQ